MKNLFLILFLVCSINSCLGQQESLIDQLYASYKADQEKNISFVFIRTREYTNTPNFDLKISYGYQFVSTQTSVLNEKTNEILTASNAVDKNEYFKFNFDRPTFVVIDQTSTPTKSREEYLLAKF